MRRGRLGVVAIVMLLTGCGTAAVPARSTPPASQPTAARTPAVPSSGRSGPITVAVVGDSLTAGTSPDFPAAVDPSTWVAQLPKHSIVLEGGWAEPGATTTSMRAGVSAADANVLVIMAGTNDVSAHVPVPTIEANLVAIRRAVGGRWVLVSAIPPDRWAPEDAVAYNARLEQLAAAQGWSWVDPWTSVRDGTTYTEGSSVDGVHPTPAAARAVGSKMLRAIERLAAS